MEQRLAAMEGTEAAIGHRQRHGGDPAAVHGLLKAGDHVICSQLGVRLDDQPVRQGVRKFGVETTFVSQTDVGEWRAAVRPEHASCCSPRRRPIRSTEVCDIRALADIAHDAGALLAVDNCFCSPALQRPIELGADLVIHSGTKYLDGQGRVMAGRHLRAGEADRRRVRAHRCARAGMTLSPFNAWVVLKGLETLGIRMQAQSANALALARWLESHPGGARLLPRPGVASAARAGDARSSRRGRRGRVLRRARRRSGGARAQRLPRDRQRRRSAEHRHQPGRHQDHHHASGQHLARPPHRGAAPGRRHRPGPDPRRRWASNTSTTSRPTSRAAWTPCDAPQSPPRAHPLRPVADRLHPPRQHPLGALSLGLRAPPRRHFILRIEDTDVERSTQEAVDVILEGMHWLGLDPTRARSTRCSAWTATARCWRRCSRRAPPTPAT